MGNAAPALDARQELIQLTAANFSDGMKRERWTGRSLALALGLPPYYVQRRMTGQNELTAADMAIFGPKLDMRVEDFYRERPQPVGGGSAFVLVEGGLTGRIAGNLLAKQALYQLS